MQINYEVSLVMLFRVKKILEQLSRTRFLRDLKFLTFSSLLRCREKRAGTAGFSNPVKHCVLENCSYVFSPIKGKYHYSQKMSADFLVHFVW